MNQCATRTCTFTGTLSDAPLDQAVAHWLPDQRRPVAWSNQSALLLLRGCVQSSGLGGRGRSFPKDKLGSLRDDAFLPQPSLAACSVDLLISLFFFPSYSAGQRRDFEPEDAPTGHPDSVCLVFLLFPRRLHQVRRAGVRYFPISCLFLNFAISGAAVHIPPFISSTSFLDVREAPTLIIRCFWLLLRRRSEFTQHCDLKVIIRGCNLYEFSRFLLLKQMEKASGRAQAFSKVIECFYAHRKLLSYSTRI